MLAWLTPDTGQFSESQDCRNLRLPGSLWSYVSGALLELTKAENWEQFGTATPDESSSFFLEFFSEYLMTNCNVGEIRPFVFSLLPPGWLALDGTAIDEDDYPALAARVPSSWLSGGNINLPDMTGRGLVGEGSGYSLGDAGGEEEHTLTTAEIPAHTHSYEVSVLTADIVGELPSPALDALAPATTGSTGGGGAHNNMPPYLVITWGIYAG